MAFISLTMNWSNEEPVRNQSDLNVFYEFLLFMIQIINSDKSWKLFGLYNPKENKISNLEVSNLEGTREMS